MSRLDKAATRSRARVKTQKARREQAARAATLALQARFLAQYAVIGVITSACRLAGIDRKRHYEWLEAKDKYPDYAQRFEDAQEQAADSAEAEMVRRGIRGWDEPVYQGGHLVGKKRMFSDRMLELALKARRPEKFRERFEHSGPGGGPLQHNVSFYLPENGRRAAS